MRLGLVLLLAAGCVPDKGPPPAAQDATPAPLAAPSAAPAPPAQGPAPASRPKAEREARVLALLRGELPATSLPEVATEPGEGLDLELREELAPQKRNVVEVASVETEGAVGPGPARSALESLRARFSGCYARGLARNPNQAGQVRAELAIGAGGRVLSAKLVASDLPDPGVRSCVIRRSEALSLPASDAGSTLLKVAVRFSPD